MELLIENMILMQFAYRIRFNIVHCFDFQSIEKTR